LWVITFLSDSISVQKVVTDVNVRVSAVGVVNVRVSAVGIVNVRVSAVGIVNVRVSAVGIGGAARNISPRFE
jgi:hypothetical protein